MRAPLFLLVGLTLALMAGVGWLVWLVEELARADSNSAVRIAQTFATMTGVFAAASTGVLLQERQRQFDRRSGALQELRALSHSLESALVALETVEDSPKVSTATRAKRIVDIDLQAVTARNLGKFERFGLAKPVLLARYLLGEASEDLSSAISSPAMLTAKPWFLKEAARAIRKTTDHTDELIRCIERGLPLPVMRSLDD